MPLPSPEPPFQETRVVRSKNRRKTVAARVEDGVLIVHVPARMSESEVRGWVERMGERFKGRARRDALVDQADLERRAARINRKYFQGRLEWASIVYVTNQTAKYGSCSPGSRRIRISHRMASMPAFVLDYIIVHELAHLLEANHGRRFWRLVQRYPLAERAIGYLMGLGLVPAQERVTEPSLFIPPDAETDLEDMPLTEGPRPVMPVDGDLDGLEDDWIDPFDDPALMGGLTS